jgi:predicted 2-oxoglutarate/Fe(II)-dependent dioxygenase YbiX
VLQQGDCVLFRGEKTEHWITPVTKGVRRLVRVWGYIQGGLMPDRKQDIAVGVLQDLGAALAGGGG